MSNPDTNSEMADQGLNTNVNVNTHPPRKIFLSHPEPLASMEFGDIQANVQGIQI